MIIGSVFIYLITLLYASIIDAREKLIYNRVYIVLIALSGVTYGINGLLAKLPGAALIALPFLILALKVDKLGGGDIKFIFCNNLYLGFWTGYAGVVTGLCLIVLVYILKWGRMKQTTREIPMVPYLSCGYLICFIIEKLFHLGGASSL